MPTFSYIPKKYVMIVRLGKGRYNVIGRFTRAAIDNANLIFTTKRAAVEFCEQHDFVWKM